MKAHQRKNGTWEVKKVDPDTGVRRSVYGKTEQEALRKASGESSGTLIWYYEHAYLPTVGHQTINSQRQIRYLFDRCLAPTLGDTPLEIIDRAMLQRVFNGFCRRDGKPLSPRSLKQIRHLLNCILKLAEEDEALGTDPRGLPRKNPVPTLRLPRIAPAENKQIGATGLKLLLDRSDGELHEFIKLCGIGMRMGEALGVGSPFMKGDVLSVEQQIQMDVKGKTRLQKTLKTLAGKREIPLPFDVPSAIFFCSLKPTQAQYQLRTLSNSLGLGEVYPHALRKTFITIMEDVLECPRRVVQELVGHRRGEVTDTYSKVSMETKRRWMAKFWEHVSGSRVVEITTEKTG